MNICHLPLEMLTEIFTYLPYSSIKLVEQVSKVWREAALSHRVWDCLPITYNHRVYAINHFFDSVRGHTQSVRYLRFISVAKYEEIDTILRSCPNVTKLLLAICCIDVKLTENLHSYCSLKELVIKNSYVRGNRDVLSKYDINFHYHPLLVTLILSDFGLSDSNFDGLLLCKNLVNINIGKIKHVSQENIIKLLTQQNYKLKSLTLFGGDSYDDSILKHISDCMNIYDLSIIRCESLTDNGLNLLNKLPKLKYLSLWNNNRFSAKALLNLFTNEKLGKLEKLSFSKIKNVSIELLRTIAKACPHIKNIGIYRCPLLIAENASDVIEEMFPLAEVFFEMETNII